MTIVEVVEQQPRVSQRQRWGNYFVYIYAVISLFIAVNLGTSTIYASRFYNNPQAGIQAYYPQNWLIDTDGDYIFRVRDMHQPQFKTTIQVSVLPVTINTQARNLLDSLILSRSRTLAAFDVLDNAPYIMPDESEATAMTYTYVESGTDPFLASLPIVVEGLDILVIRGGQAILITFLSEAEQYEENLEYFERFVNELRF